MDFKDVNRLKDKKIERGERWVLSSGFDVKPDLKETGRIDEELEDLEQLLSSGARVSILSHGGRYEDGNAFHLDYVAKYINKHFTGKVEYFPDNTNPSYSYKIKPGQAVIFGNTRFNEGEQKNDPQLAKEFARFGDFVAIGGFCKSHRKNASNYGILDYLPGFITRSLIRNMHFLEPWAGKSDEYSVAILGGRKKEKIMQGLVGFSKNYDFVIPGGIVLNTILKVLGYEIGDSLIDENKETFEIETKKVLEAYPHKIIIPESVVIANKNMADCEEIKISEGVPKGYTIVDFFLPDSAHNCLEKLILQKGRAVLAGTPGIVNCGFVAATKSIVSYLNKENTKVVALGGDTINEIQDLKCKKSIGGGASLSYLINGTLVVYGALKENKTKFG